MPDFYVEPRSTVSLERVEGDLRVGKNATIRAGNGRVVVTAGAYFEGAATIDCDFECQSMTVEGRGYGPGGNVTVRRNLIVHGRADINASVRVDGEINSEDLDVGGHLESKSLTSVRVRVGGHMKTKGKLKAESVDVGGHLSVLGDVELVNLRAGGHAEVGGGTISGEVKVRGHFTATRKLAYGRAIVYGNLRLPAGSSGERLSGLGKVEFEGDAACRIMEVNGVTTVNGNCAAEAITVNGKFDVSGTLRVSRRLEVYGASELKGRLDCETLGVGGKLTARAISAETQADIAGEIATVGGLKARSIAIGKGSKVSGPLVGERVDVGGDVNLGEGVWESAWLGNWRAIGRMTKVEDVYGNVVKIRRYSRAGHVFGEVVEMEDGSMAEGVTYTNDVKLPRNHYLNKPPVKTTRLPEPPI